MGRPGPQPARSRPDAGKACLREPGTRCDPLRTAALLQPRTETTSKMSRPKPAQGPNQPPAGRANGSRAPARNPLPTPHRTSGRRARGNPTPGANPPTPPTGGPHRPARSAGRRVLLSPKTTETSLPKSDAREPRPHPNQPRVGRADGSRTPEAESCPRPHRKSGRRARRNPTPGANPPTCGPRRPVWGAGGGVLPATHPNVRKASPQKPDTRRHPAHQRTAPGGVQRRTRSPCPPRKTTNTSLPKSAPRDDAPTHPNRNAGEAGRREASGWAESSPTERRGGVSGGGSRPRWSRPNPRPPVSVLLRRLTRPGGAVPPRSSSASRGGRRRLLSPGRRGGPGCP